MMLEFNCNIESSHRFPSNGTNNDYLKVMNVPQHFSVLAQCMSLKHKLEKVVSHLVDCMVFSWGQKPALPSIASNPE